MKYPYIVCKDGKWYPAGTEVPEDAKVDGTLNTNADGSVNAYDAEGNVVGTVPAEDVEKLQEQAGETLMNQNNQDDNLNGSEEDSEKQEDDGTPAQEQDKSKRGRKSKEE